MASFDRLCAASHMNIAPSPTTMPQLGKNRFTEFAPMPTTQKWSLSEDLTLISNPTKHDIHKTGNLGFSDEFYVKHEQKVKEVRSVLRKVGENPLEGLVMIDTLQRLSIDYHFQEEIEALLQKQYMESTISNGYPEFDLYEVSTRFRLLRQEGYNVPADVFNNFKNKEGRFKSELGTDIKGLMALYEASHLSIKGDDILDQAADYSCLLLDGWMMNLDQHQARLIDSTLRHPYHKNLARFTARSFVSDYKGINGWVDGLQELATMDFKMVQSTNQREILQFSEWWKDMGLANDLKNARNQPLKWYMWPMAALTNPCLSQQRVELTKPISLIYRIDDIFDVYGTLEELTLFTEAVNRWDLAAVENLPYYMKSCFNALYDTTNEISYKIYKAHGWNPIDSLHKTWASLCNAFLVEAKWFASGQLPNSEEYLKTAVVSSGVHVVLVHMFFLLGHGITRKTVDLVNDNPGIITSTATILRLWDDLGSAKDEGQDGHDGSYVDCYMKDHKGSSVNRAREQVNRMISDAWKCLNQECLSPNSFSASFTKSSLNLARMVPLMYSYDDNHKLPILQEHMKSMLYDDVSL
ncbi:(3S,6E)-nerolidol synthase 1-like [Rhododendron vialii]|uniref:(3S,6E)-nerolidol synthase 1-like n=1 Tax=Rhododendron vialii TaxID=182163 RepID=UPI00265F862A|nr:(3S,6E)-nerolidol synthase 1-like [Rhododendron vialii]